MSQFKYQNLITNLEKDIFPNMASGELLPLDKDICEKYQVSRITVKKAMNILAEEGRVRRIPGKGTVLSSKHKRTHSFESNNELGSIKILTLNNWNTADLLERQCNDFKQLHSNVNFEFHRVSDIYYEECKLENYDIVLCNSWMLREYLTSPIYQKDILPLSEIPGLFIDKNMFFQNVIKWNSIDDELYCLPLGVSPVFVMYNLNYPGFCNCNLDVDNCNDLESFCNLLYELKKTKTDDENFFPFLLSLEYNRLPCFIKMQEGSMFDATTLDCNLDSSVNIGIYKFINKLLSDKIMYPSIFDIKGLGSDLLYADRVACMFGTYKYLRDSLNSKYKIKYGMLPNSDKSSCSHLLLESLLVTKNCTNLKVVSDLLNYLQTSKSQLEICRYSDGFSAQKDLAELYLQSLALKEPSVMNIFKQMEYSEPVAASVRIKKWRKLFEMLPKLWMGIYSIENVCHEITKEVNNAK